MSATGITLYTCVKRERDARRGNDSERIDRNSNVVNKDASAKSNRVTMCLWMLVGKR